MRIMELRAIAPRPSTSKPNPGHEVYPCLLRGVAVTRANQVWAADITYLRAYEDLREARKRLQRYVAFYNDERPHTAHGGWIPSAAYDPNDRVHFKNNSG
jgi:transposase InsO family protein